MVEIAPDGEGGLFSESLNLWLRWEDLLGHVRLLRPYLPDGTPISTSVEEKHLREAAQAMAAENQNGGGKQKHSERRREAEAELERLRAQLANRQDEGT